MTARGFKLLNSLPPLNSALQDGRPLKSSYARSVFLTPSHARGFVTNLAGLRDESSRCNSLDPPLHHFFTQLYQMDLQIVFLTSATHGESPLPPGQVDLPPRFRRSLLTGLHLLERPPELPDTIRQHSREFFPPALSFLEG